MQQNSDLPRSWKYMSKTDRKRHRARREAAKLTEAVENNQCGNKIQHDNFFTAMQHCGQLCDSLGILYMVYHCETCGFAHVGHSPQASITWMYEGYAETFQTKLR